MWVGFCLYFAFDSAVPRYLETRVGVGHYSHHDFLHIKLDTGRLPPAQPVFGASDPLMPQSSYRQFMRCRR